MCTKCIEKGTERLYEILISCSLEFHEDISASTNSRLCGNIIVSVILVININTIMGTIPEHIMNSEVVIIVDAN